VDGSNQAQAWPPAAARSARVVLLTGPSGCGKSRVTKQLGLPKVRLDNFYFDHDHPGLPHRFGIVDWDDPATWDGDGAMTALIELCTTGHATIPDYDIPTSSRVGSRTIDLAGSNLVVAEGVFAAELVARCRTAGLLADAICLRRRRLVTFWFRLVRDLREGRKSVLTLIRRGIGLYQQEPQLIAAWEAKGCRPLSIRETEKTIAALATLP